MIWCMGVHMACITSGGKLSKRIMMAVVGVGGSVGGSVDGYGSVGERMLRDLEDVERGFYMSGMEVRRGKDEPEADVEPFRVVVTAGSG